MDAVCADSATSPLPEKEKALFTLIERANRAASSVRREDVDAARAAGWDDEAIYDALTVAALFHFYNVWIDGTGVHPMPE